MEAIISTTQSEVDSLDELLSGYCVGVKHPTENKWAHKIKTRGYYWPGLKIAISTERLSRIEELTEDWFG